MLLVTQSCVLQVSYVGQCAAMPHVQYHAGSASGGNAVYLVGGEPTPYTHAVKYNISSNTWQNLDSLNNGRLAYPCVFLLEKKLCAAGGWDLAYHNSMECVNVDNNTATWEPSVTLPYPLERAQCATVSSSAGSFVILTGGFNGIETLNLVYKWIGTGSWVALTSMEKARQNHCTVSDGTKYVYVLGGMEGEMMRSSIERYDTQENKWEFMAPMPEALIYHACVYTGDTIVVTGGYDKTGMIMKNTIYLYSVKSDTWILSPTTLPQHMYGHAMAALP